MFRGVTALNLDAKSRIAMPTRFRDQLRELSDGKLVVTIDIFQRCLALYPLPEWEAIETKLSALSSFNAMSVRVKRLLIGNATDVELDGHGRFLIPPKLRQHAGLEKRAVMIGQGNKFELWDEDAWDASCNDWLAEAGAGEGVPAELENLSL